MTLDPVLRRLASDLNALGFRWALTERCAYRRQDLTCEFDTLSTAARRDA